MGKFTEADIAKYLVYVDEHLIPRSELIGHCFMCGVLLNNVPVPNGPENKVVCLKHRTHFEKEFKEIFEYEAANREILDFINKHPDFL
jgi:hypothetical protein